MAGAFYPADAPPTRARRVGAAAEARAKLPDEEPAPKALIAPHAGYIYSGPVAATAVCTAGADRRTDQARRPARAGAPRCAAGLALPGALAFETPLGSVVGRSSRRRRFDRDLPQVTGQPRSPRAGAFAGSAPARFCRALLGEFTLVPLVVGRAEPEEVAEVLERLWGGDETLIVISSDLSHYLTYDQAQARDRDTARTILNRQPSLNPYQACGAAPVNGLLLAATRMGLGRELLDLRNSGDTAGDRRAWSVTAHSASTRADSAAADNPGETSDSDRALGHRGRRWAWASDPRGPRLPARGTAPRFVTLMRHGKLRGCIGTLQAHRKLLDDVKANAKAAAFLDPRFEPLTATELRSDADRGLAAFRPASRCASPARRRRSPGCDPASTA